LAKPSTRTAGRLLAVTTCLLYTAAAELGKRQQGHGIRLEPIIIASSWSEPENQGAQAAEIQMRLLGEVLQMYAQRFSYCEKQAT
jgi:hypothetical protein